MSRNAIRVMLLALVLVGMLGASPLADNAPSPQEAAVRLVASDRSGLTLELTLPDAAVEAVTLDGRRYESWSVLGLVSGAEPGHPDLPRKVVTLGVPLGAELSLTATALEVETLPGSHRLAPVPNWQIASGEVGPQLIGSELPKPVYAPDEVVYSSKSAYPTETARLDHVGFIRSQRVASLELTPFRYNPTSGELQMVRRLRVRLAYHYPAGAAQDQGTFRAEDPSFEKILSRSLLNYEEAQFLRLRSGQALRVTPGAKTSALAAPWTPPDPAWKIRVDEAGLYRLTYVDLEAAGLPVETLDPRTFQLYNQGAEVAIRVVGQEDGSLDDGDYVDFYGQALDTLYADTNVYWLTYGVADGQRMATRDGTPDDSSSPTSFAATTGIEEQHEYWPGSQGDNRWFWEQMYAVEPISVTMTGDLGFVATDKPTGTVSVFLYGTTYNSAVNPDHHALVYLNDHLIADAWWDGKVPYSMEVEVPRSYLADVTNTFRVEMPLDTGSLYDGIYVDKFAVEYSQAHRAVNGELTFHQDQAGTWPYRIDGLDAFQVLAFDVTDPTQAVQFTGGIPWDRYRLFLPVVPGGQSGMEAATDTDGTVHVFRFQDTVTGPTEYYVVAADRARQPLSIEPDVPSNLADTANQADYIMIAHDDFYASTQPLAAYWQSQGMAVELVRLSDIYDEFSYGIMDATAIRDFLTHAYANWQSPQVSYVLLVGDGTYDYRDFQGYGLPLGVPTYLMPTPYIGETGSDNWYACVSGEADDYLPDLHIGRLPAQSVAQANLMVSKVLAYAQSPPTDAWNQNVLFVADNADGAGNFAAYSDVLVDNYLPPAYTPHKVYFQITHATQPEVTAAISGTLNSGGSLLVNYIGHGAIYSWAHEKLWLCFDDRCDFDDLDNAGQLPFVVSMTCSDGYYFHPNLEFTSLAEGWLLKDGGGGIGSFAATGLGVANGHDYMNRALFTAIFTDHMPLGPATTESKLELYNQTGSVFRDLIETYHLFGDPALSLNLP